MWEESKMSELNISQFLLFFPPTGAVFDENTGKILVVQDRNKVSCSYL